MAKWSANNPGFTPVAVADTTNFTDNGHLTVQGGSATQVNAILEVTVGGIAAASAPTPMTLARDSTVGATLSGARLAAADPATAALAAPPVAFSVSTTKPQRSATLSLANLALNAFGGLAKWWAMDANSGFRMLGNAASLGEISLSCYTGGTPGLVSAHMIIEPV